jgi:alpha-glucosidase
MYVVYQNHLPMLADSPTAYRGQAGFDFLVDVPCNWDETRVLKAELGRCIAVARRHREDWYVGGMTANTVTRDLELPLHFLTPGRWNSQLYLDDPSAGPTSITQQTKPLSNNDVLRVNIPAAGGFAGKISPAR